MMCYDLAHALGGHSGLRLLGPMFVHYILLN